MKSLTYWTDKRVIRIPKTTKHQSGHRWGRARLD